MTENLQEYQTRLNTMAEGKFEHEISLFIRAFQDGTIKYTYGIKAFRVSDDLLCAEGFGKTLKLAEEKLRYGLKVWVEKSLKG